MSGLRVEGLTYAYPKASENITDHFIHELFLLSFLQETGR